MVNSSCYKIKKKCLKISAPINIPRGPKGADGVQGVTGATGATGDDGPTGEPGAQGVQGAQGAQGATGSNGLDGAQGDKGHVGPIGLPGDSGIINKTFPIRDCDGVNMGDLVVVGKGADGNAEVHKLLCEQWEWAASVDFSLSSTYITTDCQGNVYVSGRIASNSNGNFYNSNNDSLNNPDITSSLKETNNTFIAKINSSGIWQWVATVDADIYDRAGNMTVDRCGNVYLSCYSIFTPTFTSSDGTDLIGRTNSSIHVAKINPDGIWQWTASSGNPSGSLLTSTSVVSDNCGNLYIMAANIIESEQEFFNADNVNNPADKIGRTGSSMFVAKLSSVGKWEWVVGIDIDQHIDQRSRINKSITTDSCGNIYTSTTTIDSATKFYNTTPSGNAGNTVSLVGRTPTSKTNEIAVAKLNSSGEWQWVASIDSLNAGVLPTAIVADCCGNVYVSGWGGGGDDGKSISFYNEGNNSPAVDVLGTRPNTTSRRKMFIGKIKSSGIWEWAALADANVANDDTYLVASPLAVDDCCNVYFTGRSEGTPLFYDAGSNGNTITTHSISGKDPLGPTQLYLSKLSPDGNWKWVAGIDKLGTDEIDIPGDPLFQDGREYGPSVAVDNCGNVYVVGQADYTSRPNFYDAAANGDTLIDIALESVNRESTNLFVAKLANEARSATLIGVVDGLDCTGVDIDTAEVNLRGFIDGISPGCSGCPGNSGNDNNLIPGCTYYIDCSRAPCKGSGVHVPCLTTNPCSDCCCPNRRVGVACDTDSMIWNPEQPLCAKKKECCPKTKDLSIPKCVSITFDELTFGDIGGCGVPENPIDKYLSSFGITVSVDIQGNATNTITPRKLMIFDSSKPNQNVAHNDVNATTVDLDLGTPNESFGPSWTTTTSPPTQDPPVDAGYPGVGVGGQIGNPGENRYPKGNLLIISTDNDSIQPNDSSDGGIITFELSRSVMTFSVGFIDADSNSNHTITLFDSTGNGVVFKEIPTLGNNSCQRLYFEECDIKKIVVKLSGSGGIFDLKLNCPVIFNPIIVQT